MVPSEPQYCADTSVKYVGYLQGTGMYCIDYCTYCSAFQFFVYFVLQDINKASNDLWGRNTDANSCGRECLEEVRKEGTKEDIWTSGG